VTDVSLISFFVSWDRSVLNSFYSIYGLVNAIMNRQVP